MHRSRERGQGVVEFGLVAIVFTLIMFAIVDFGLLLNGWLTVSSDAEKLARDAATGATSSQLNSIASAYGIPGVTAETPHFAGYCCDANDALILSVTYYSQCVPNPNTPSCVGVAPASALDSRYVSGTTHGTCDAALTLCPHPARPSPTNTATCHPGVLVGPSCPGDTVVVRLTAAGARVITPLVRPFFNCPEGGAAPCYVAMSSTVSMRFDGVPLVP